ncbi:MAG: YraN family protein [Pseudomonadota bacterium]
MANLTPQNPRKKRQTAERSGRVAEWVVALYYRLSGARILTRRFKRRSGEADIIAFKNGTLIIVEVKRRRTIDAAIEAVTLANRRRIEQVTASYQAHRPQFAHCGVRYDIAAMAGYRLVILKDAWRQGE